MGSSKNVCIIPFKLFCMVRINSRKETSCDTFTVRVVGKNDRKKYLQYEIFTSTLSTKVKTQISFFGERQGE